MDATPNKAPRPLGLLAELTHRCPLGCPYCSNPLALEGRRKASANPWRATGLEWSTASPPPKHNFERTPRVSDEPYRYDPERGTFVTQEGTSHAE